MSKLSRTYPLTIAQVQWQLDDLEQAFQLAGIEPTKEQMDQLIVDDKLMEFMQSLIKLAGTHVLADMVSELFTKDSVAVH
jgi:hypothetical protein